MMPLICIQGAFFCSQNAFNSILFTCFDLPQGATILDQPVCITNWGQSEDEFNIWNRPSWKLEDESSETVCAFIYVFDCYRRLIIVLFL